MSNQHQDFENGKYTVVREDGGGLKALRYGEQWRDLTGDKLVGAMLDALEAQAAELAALKAGDPACPVVGYMHTDNVGDVRLLPYINTSWQGQTVEPLCKVSDHLAAYNKEPKP